MEPEKQAEKPDPANYVYCKKCDIFYNKQLKEKADAKWEKAKKEGDMVSFVVLLKSFACPMCAHEITAIEQSMSRSIEAEHPHMHHNRGFVIKD
jgi:hypothetical protein